MLSCSELTKGPLHTTECIPSEVGRSNTDPNESASKDEDEASNGDEDEEEEEEEVDSTGRATRSSRSKQSQQQQKAVNGKSLEHGDVVWVNGQKKKKSPLGSFCHLKPFKLFHSLLQEVKLVCFRCIKGSF